LGGILAANPIAVGRMCLTVVLILVILIGPKAQVAKVLAKPVSKLFEERHAGAMLLNLCQGQEKRIRVNRAKSILRQQKPRERLLRPAFLYLVHVESVTIAVGSLPQGRLIHALNDTTLRLCCGLKSPVQWDQTFGHLDPPLRAIFEVDCHQPKKRLFNTGPPLACA
jgi:hypothetical protein